MNEGMGEPKEGSELQFDKAELPAEAASRVCPICQRPIGLEYFEVVGNVVCPTCADELQHGKGGAPFLRGVLFGAGAAVVSAIVWYVIVKVTGYELGIIAIAVGFFVGMAVRRGARVAGGWRYQALAMALTYMAITGSRVPIIVDGLREAQAQEQKAETAKAASADGTAPSEKAAAAEAPPTLAGFIRAWLMVFALALAMPFLVGANGILGIIIIGIGLYEAWKLNRRVPVNGPFRFGMAPATT
jgi:hypothetical protein